MMRRHLLAAEAHQRACLQRQARTERLAAPVLRLLPVAALAIAALLLTACGGGGDDTPTPYDACVHNYIGPLQPGKPPFACLGLEGAPTP